MAVILPRQCKLIEEEHATVSQKEHYLYFPSITKNIQNIWSILPSDNFFYEFDQEKCPDWDNICDKYNYSPSDEHIILGSPLFIQKILYSQEVTICDMHIDESFFYYLIKILEKGLEKMEVLHKIEIFMSSHKIDSKILKKMKNLNSTISIKIYHIDNKYTKIFHDRFVCFDEELWHFGGTVGGIQKSLTAFSTGWNSCGLKHLLQTCIRRKYFWEEKNNG